MSEYLLIPLGLLVVSSLCTGVGILAYRIGHTNGQIAGIEYARKHVNLIGGHLK